MILARVLKHVRQIVIRLARHPDPVFSQDVGLVDRYAGALLPPGVVVDRVGYPLRADFDEGELRPRKSGWNVADNERMERPDNGELELGKTRLFQKKIVDIEAAGRRMDADGQIETARFLIHREKMRIAQQLVAFQPAHKNSAGAVFQISISQRL